MDCTNFRDVAAPSLAVLLSNQKQLASTQRAKGSGRPVTCPCVSPPDGVRVRPEEGRTDEASKVHRRADYLGVEGARGGGEDGRPGSQAWDFRGDDLQLEGQIRWHGCVRGEET